MRVESKLGEHLRRNLARQVQRRDVEVVFEVQPLSVIRAAKACSHEEVDSACAAKGLAHESGVRKAQLPHLRRVSARLEGAGGNAQHGVDCLASSVGTP